MRFNLELMDMWRPTKRRRPTKRIVENWSLASAGENHSQEEVKLLLENLSNEDDLLFSQLLVRIFYSCPLPPTKKSYSYESFSFKVQFSKVPLIKLGILYIPDENEEKFKSYVEEAVYPQKYYKQLLEDRKIANREKLAEARRALERKAEEEKAIQIVSTSEPRTDSSFDLEKSSSFRVRAK